MKPNTLHALDFDGVICDSAVETAITGWKAAGKLWKDMKTETPPALIDEFRRVRPIIETGYEAILAMRLLHTGVSCAAIYDHYSEMTAQLLHDTNIGVDELKQLFGDTRDQWIASDLASWIAMNPLFPGIAEKLQHLSKTHLWYVITTKQERFVKHILKANAIELADERIFGLDRKLGKTEILKDLLRGHPGLAVEFVEDRLPTLINASKDPELPEVELLFASWGYNTADDKLLAKRQGFTTLSLDDFLV
ncbi:MAG: HAD family hydrolase [Methylomonas sp.]|nr:HAD family hydrolase [Methylomonas sp.]